VQTQVLVIFPVGSTRSRKELAPRLTNFQDSKIFFSVRPRARFPGCSPRNKFSLCASASPSIFPLYVFEYKLPQPFSRWVFLPHPGVTAPSSLPTPPFFYTYSPGHLRPASGGREESPPPWKVFFEPQAPTTFPSSIPSTNKWTTVSGFNPRPRKGFRALLLPGPPSTFYSGFSHISSSPPPSTRVIVCGSPLPRNA